MIYQEWCEPVAASHATETVGKIADRLREYAAFALRLGRKGHLDMLTVHAYTLAGMIDRGSRLYRRLERRAD